MDEILTTSRDLELEVNEDDIEELIMGHEDELTIEEFQEILNEEHHETQRNVSPSEQEEDERGPMPTSAIKATRGLLATDHVILNHGQVTWTTPELAPPLLTTTPHQREDVSALDRFNVHRCPTRRVFSGTGIELMTCLPWLDTLTTGLPQPLGGCQSNGLRMAPKPS
ncbi:uncharacterized protein TNCV_2904041 [Trichonephila clavipes]|nr:uncharacterized protein TNCV_2904041 [Trichonephila clavipes]